MKDIDKVLEELTLHYKDRTFTSRDLADFSTEQNIIICSALNNLNKKGKIEHTGEFIKDRFAKLNVYKLCNKPRTDFRKAENKYRTIRGLSRAERKANSIGVRLHEAFNRMTRSRHESSQA